MLALGPTPRLPGDEATRDSMHTMQAMDMFDMGEGHSSLLEGVGNVKSPVLVLGVTSDVLFPVEQQREMASLLKETGMLSYHYWFSNHNGIAGTKVTYYELSSIYGHDTFLLDFNNLGVAIKVSHIIQLLVLYYIIIGIP